MATEHRYCVCKDARRSAKDPGPIRAMFVGSARQGHTRVNLRVYVPQLYFNQAYTNIENLKGALELWCRYKTVELQLAKAGEIEFRDLPEETSALLPHWCDPENQDKLRGRRG